MFDKVLTQRVEGVRQIWTGNRKGWLICLAVLLVTAFRRGLTYSFGSFIVDLRKVFLEEKMTTFTYTAAISDFLAAAFAPVALSLIRLVGHHGFRVIGLIGIALLVIGSLGSSFVPSARWLFLTYGLFFGVGSNFVYMASSMVIGDHFPTGSRYHVLATSVIMCGYPIGSMLFNPFYAWLIETYDFRVAFRCASALCLVVGVVGCWNFTPSSTAYRHLATDTENTGTKTQDDDDEDEDAESDEDKTALMANEDGKEKANEGGLRCCRWAMVVDRPEAVLWYLGILTTYLGLTMPFYIMEPYLTDRSIPLTKSSLAVMILSLAECVTYILASFIGDRLKDRLIYVNVVASVGLAAVCIAWPFVDVNFAAILMLHVGFGSFIGLDIVYTYAASLEVTRMSQDVAWAGTNIWMGVGMLLSPVCTGLVFDLTGTYDAIFHSVGVAFAVAALSFGFIALIRRRRCRQNSAAACT